MCGCRLIVWLMRNVPVNRLVDAERSVFSFRISLSKYGTFRFSGFSGFGEPSNSKKIHQNAERSGFCFLVIRNRSDRSG